MLDLEELKKELLNFGELHPDKCWELIDRLQAADTDKFILNGMIDIKDAQILELQSKLDELDKQEPAICVHPGKVIDINPNYEGPIYGEFYAKPIPAQQSQGGMELQPDGSIHFEEPCRVPILIPMVMAKAFYPERFDENGNPIQATDIVFGKPVNVYDEVDRSERFGFMTMELKQIAQNRRVTDLKLDGEITDESM